MTTGPIGPGYLLDPPGAALLVDALDRRKPLRDAHRAVVAPLVAYVREAQTRATREAAEEARRLDEAEEAQRRARRIPVAEAARRANVTPSGYRKRVHRDHLGHHYVGREMFVDPVPLGTPPPRQPSTRDGPSAHD